MTEPEITASESLQERSKTTTDSPAYSRRHLIFYGALILVLALGALLWPGTRHGANGSVLLVFDSGTDQSREELLFSPLAGWLSDLSDQTIKLVVVDNREEFVQWSNKGVAFIFCPDGLALSLNGQNYSPIVCARRAVPQNQRPRCVVVYNLDAPESDTPWLEYPDRTVFGDSLSLVATGVVQVDRQGFLASIPNSTWGPDPYDHSLVLHAARLKCFDYAVVRQWDAEDFFQLGMMSTTEWGTRVLSGPVPDVVLMASTDETIISRSEIRETLTSVGRAEDADDLKMLAVKSGLERLGLVGFNLLLENDFKQVRRNISGNWPPPAD